MNTTNRIRFAALTVAIGITALLQGSMLWNFDTLAQQAVQPSVTQVTIAEVASQNS
jgi:hypothetical protein